MDDGPVSLSKAEMRLLFKAIRNIAIVPRIEDSEHRDMLIQESIVWLREFGFSVWPRIATHEQLEMLRGKSAADD